jgi:WD40 repeat protein
MSPSSPVLVLGLLLAAVAPQEQAAPNEEGLPPGVALRLGRPQQGNGHEVSSLAFSPDGTRVAAPGPGFSVLLWDVASGKELRRFAGHHSDVNSVALSPDGKLLATGSDDTTLRFWDVESGRELHEIQERDSGFHSLAFSSDGKTLAATGAGDTVHLLEVPSGKEILNLQGQNEAADSVALSPDGRILAVGTSTGIISRTVHVWDLTTRKELSILEGHEETIRLAFSPDGRYLASASSQHLVCLWELAGGARAFKLQRDSISTHALAFSPDASALAVAGTLGIAFWDVPSGKRILEGWGPRKPVISLGFSPDGRRLATGMRDGTVLLWDLPRERPSRPWLLPPDLDDLEGPWNDLSSRDAGRAHRALWILAQGAERSVELLKSRLSPLPPPPDAAAALQRAIGDLDKDDASARDAATKLLQRSGAEAEGPLRAVLRGSPSPELRARVESLIAPLEQPAVLPHDDLLRRLRAIEALESIGSKSARELLGTLSTESLSKRERAAIKESLARLEKRPAVASAPSPAPKPPKVLPIPAKPEPKFEEQLLATIPAGATWTGLAISPDGRQAGYMGWDPQRRKGFAVVGGSKGEEFDRVRQDGAFQQAMVYSADGKHLAYFAADRNQWWLVLDGRKCGSGFDSDKRPEPYGFGDPVFSADGRHVAYHVKEWSTRRDFVVVDDRTGPAFSYILDPVVFSPDASIVAFSAADPTGNPGFIVVGNRIGEPQGRVAHPVFSSDGKHFAYSASGGSKEFIVLDDRELDNFDGVGAPVFSPDGKRLAYPARIRTDDDEEHWHIVIDGNRGKPFDNVHSVVFSPDGRQLAYAARKGKKWHVVVGDQEGEAFDEVDVPVFSPDGTSVAYPAKRGDKYVLVAGGKTGEEFDRVWPPVFSPDGKKIAYGARKGLELIWKILELK